MVRHGCVSKVILTKRRCSDTLTPFPATCEISPSPFLRKLGIREPRTSPRRESFQHSVWSEPGCTRSSHRPRLQTAKLYVFSAIPSAATGRPMPWRSRMLQQHTGCDDVCLFVRSYIKLGCCVEGSAEARREWVCEPSAGHMGGWSRGVKRTIPVLCIQYLLR